MSDIETSNRLPALADTVRRAHAGTIDAAKSAAAFAIEAGEALIEAKGLLKHGQWLPWLSKHCGLSPRSAQGYMQLARASGGENAQRVAHLSIREALRVIAESPDPSPLPKRGASHDELWAWADRQIKAPFNRFDFDNLASRENKLLHIAGVPSAAAIVLKVPVKWEPPPIRIVEDTDLIATLSALAPWVEDDHEPDCFDYAGMTFLEEQQLRLEIKHYAFWIMGRVLNELDYRRRHFKGDSAADAWRLDRKDAFDAWIKDIDEQAAALANVTTR
jgi:hypothetical protein